MGLRDVFQDRLALESILTALGVRWAGALSTAAGLRYATEAHWRSLTVALAHEYAGLFSRRDGGVRGRLQAGRPNFEVLVSAVSALTYEGKVSFSSFFQYLHD